MFKDKKTVLTYTLAARVMELLGFLLLMTVMYVVALIYPDAPPELPTHFDANGLADAWDVKEIALQQPILAAFLYIVLTGVGVIIRRAVPRDNPGGALSAAMTTLLCAKAVYLAYAVLDTYYAVSGLREPRWLAFFLPAGLAVTAAFGARSILRRRKARNGI
ncbi:MAG: DUF1648 domain-containing protein [Oscillospiraceae bacterium]|jgi:uncharacterized membrane protein|nr:DUF1648 domain-containing protein [Oscillospiraceae bacterium]